MLGLHFESCNPLGFSVSFDRCMLHHASFYRLHLKKTLFKHSTLQEVDFTACDLSGSVFDSCDLAGAVFDNTVLEKSDFRTSFHYSIDPGSNRIKKARFSLSGVSGLLHRYDIEIDGA
jgi:fluoroquinolone resistance protein